MRIPVSHLFFLFSAMLLVGCADAEVGTKQWPFTMYFVPHQDSEGIVATAEGASKFVEKYISQAMYGKDTGFHVKSAIPINYVAVVEAFGTKKADFATLHTFAYILAKDIKKLNVEPILTALRENDKTYKGQIVVRSDSGIKNLEDLKGKKFAYTDPSSTSGFLLPRKLFQDKNIQLGEVVFANKHDNVVMMVYQKQVDAGATFYSEPLEKMENGKKVKHYRDARKRVVTQYPDVFEKVVTLAFTESTPNEPYVLRRGIYADPEKDQRIRQLVIEALLAYSKTTEGAKALADYYDVTGLVEANDQIYDGIRQIVLQANINIEEMFTKKPKG